LAAVDAGRAEHVPALLPVIVLPPSYRGALFNQSEDNYFEENIAGVVNFKSGDAPAV
jgi:hypothetical protein